MNETGTDQAVQNGNRDGREGVPVGDGRHEAAHTAFAALTEMARTIDDLKGRIDPAIAEMRHALITNDPEVEIGKLFVHAQEFIDQAVTEAQQNAAQLLAEARSEAGRIIAEGHKRSRNAVEQAALIASAPAAPAPAPAPATTGPAPTPVFVDVAQQLRQSMEAFTRRNSELTDALGPTGQ
jgi:cell division septum initiation protein DivIVA